MGNLKMAIADPPYLGTAKRFYGLDGVGNGKGSNYITNTNPNAELFDDPATHLEMLDYLQDNFDSWAIAMNTHSLGTYLKKLKMGGDSGYRICSWIRTNSQPTGSRIRPSWEPVLIYNHSSRRSYAHGARTKDYLICGAPRNGFIGAKPYEWTEWVTNLLGYTEGDKIADLFPGSGAVTAALIELNCEITNEIYETYIKEGGE
jgi:hypothetical protein